MTQQSSEQHAVRCLLCTNQVQKQGDVCSQCNPRYMDLGRSLLEYERQLTPILASSPRKHISVRMRFASDVYFFLKELDEPVPYEGQVITHCLTVMSLNADRSLQRDYWYGRTIASTLMAATVNRDFTMMGFPEEPEYFVPISSSKPVASSSITSINDETTREGRDDRQ